MDGRVCSCKCRLYCGLCWLTSGVDDAWLRRRLGSFLTSGSVTRSSTTFSSHLWHHFRNSPTRMAPPAYAHAASPVDARLSSVNRFPAASFEHHEELERRMEAAGLGQHQMETILLSDTRIERAPKLHRSLSSTAIERLFISMFPTISSISKHPFYSSTPQPRRGYRPFPICNRKLRASAIYLFPRGIQHIEASIEVDGHYNHYHGTGTRQAQFDSIITSRILQTSPSPRTTAHRTRMVTIAPRIGMDNAQRRSNTKLFPARQARWIRRGQDRSPRPQSTRTRM